MKFRNFLSRIGFVILAAGDLIFAYAATGTLLAIPVTAVLLLIGIAILFFLALLNLQARPLSQCRSMDANRLLRNFAIVKQKLQNSGGHCPNVKLYISRSPSRNAFSLGNHIIFTEGMMQESDMVLQAVIVHELGHTLHYDSYFSSLLQCNLFCFTGLFLLSQFGVLLFVGVLLFFVFCIAFGGFAAMAITGLFTKIVRGFCNLFLKLAIMLHNLFAALLFRQQEYAADALTVPLGCSTAMKYFLEDLEQSEPVQLNFTEQLLSDHPSNYARIAKLEQAEAAQTTQIV